MNQAERIIAGQPNARHSGGGEWTILCPWHNERTPSCCVNVRKKVYICHGCGKRGRLAGLFVKLNRISYREARMLSGELPGGMWKPEKEKDVCLPSEYFALPRRGIIAGIAMRYLLGRRITVGQIQKYSIGFCPTGRYRNRVIIPITLDGELVSFVARDWTGRAERKVLHPVGAKAAEALFGYDQAAGIASTLVLVEGWADKLAVDRALAHDRMFADWAAVAIGGKVLSHEKLALVSGFDRFVVMLDREAELDALKMRQLLSFHRRPIRIVQVSGKDPAETDEREILEALR